MNTRDKTYLVLFLSRRGPSNSQQKEEIKKKEFFKQSRSTKEKVRERDIFQTYYVIIHARMFL
jgi:hypothetical protein